MRLRSRPERMKRRLLNFLTALSLLLGVAVAALWVRSIRYFDEWWWRDVKVTGGDEPVGTEEASHVAIASGDGVMAIQWGTRHSAGSARSGSEDQWRWERLEGSKYPPDLHLVYHADREFAGFGWTDRRHTRGSLTAPGVPADADQGYVVQRYRIAKIPLLLPLLLTAALPISRAARFTTRRARRRRARHGHCPACGYDLRATPGRCPECGHVPAGVKA